MGDTMQAVGFEEHGSLDELQLLTVGRPEPAANEVLVEVSAASLNHQDLFAVRQLDHYVPSYPFWGGGDIAGVVDALGSAVEGWAVGDRVVVNPAISCDTCEFCRRGEHSMCANYEVFGEHRHGGFAEYVAVPATNLVEIPDGYAMVDAAAVPMAAGTAWRALVTRGELAPFESVLIVGATGGVGTYAVQIARNVFDVRSLYATTSTDEKAEFLGRLGVDHVVDYTQEAFDERIWRLTDGRGVDLVYNNVGGDTWTRAMRSLRNGGRLIVSGATAGPTPATELRLLFVRQLDVRGSTTHNRSEFKQVLEYVWDGTIEPVIDATYPLADYETAFRLMADRNLHGKVVLTLD